MSNLSEPSKPRSVLKRPNPFRWILVALLAAGVIALAAFVFTRGGPDETPTRASVEPAPPAAEATPSLPPAAETDPMVRQLVTRLCASPGLVSWLMSDDLLRRFTAAVDNIARGESPAPHLSALAPEGDFRVRRRRGHTYIDRRSYARYDRVASTLAALETQSCAKAYGELKPMLERAYREVGRPGRTFEQALAGAIHRLTALPAPRGDVEVVQHVRYHYADTGLEGLSPAEKHLLRMGPANMERVQTKLRELAAAIGLPEAAG